MPINHFVSVVGSLFKIAVLGAVLSACTYSHTVDVAQQGLQRAGLSDRFEVLRGPSFTLPAGSLLYVVYPYNATNMLGSMPRFRTQLQKALVEIGHSRGFPGIAGGYQQALPEALLDAEANSCDFLLAVTVAQLQQSEGKPEGPSDIRLLVNVYDVRGRHLLGTLTVTSERGVWQGSADTDLSYGSAAAILDSLYAAPR